MTHSSPDNTTGFRVIHLTTVDLSLRFLVRPQLLEVAAVGGEPIGVSAPGPWVAELESQGVRHVPLQASTRGMSPLRDLLAVGQLWRVLRRERPTVLHTHNPKPGLYGRVVGRLAGVPLVVNTMHGLYATDQDRLAKRAVVYGLEAIAARFSDVELHQNPEDLELVRAKRILPKGKGELLGNGVDLTRFDPARVGVEARRQIREELGIADDQIVVGMVGRLVAEKGYPELFEAVSQLGSQYRLMVAGPDDPDKPDALPREMIARAAEAGVVFLGMRTDVEALYSAMDVFVLPSHREGFPRAAMEAAAMGLPLVVTDIRGCRQVVDDGENGLLVPVRSPEALRDAIEVIGGDSALRSEMSIASRRIAQERFDEDRVVEIVMTSYREGLIEKGLGHLLPAGLAGEDRMGKVRAAGKEDFAALAGLHSSQIDSGFLPSLGPRFMRVLYRALLEWPDAAVFVVDDESGPVGFVAGVTDVGAFYRFFARRYGLRAGLAALPRLLRPSTVRGAWESLRYGSDDGDIAAELLSMAVAPRVRGRGLSGELGLAFLQNLESRGCAAVRVVVGTGNRTAIGAYEKMGFRLAGQTEVHSGESSEVLVWRS